MRLPFPPFYSSLVLFQFTLARRLCSLVKCHIGPGPAVCLRSKSHCPPHAHRHKMSLSIIFLYFDTSFCVCVYNTGYSIIVCMCVCVCVPPQEIFQSSATIVPRLRWGGLLFEEENPCSAQSSGMYRGITPIVCACLSVGTFVLFNVCLCTCLCICR